MPNNYQDKPKLNKVFYDGACRLCSNEIEFYYWHVNINTKVWNMCVS